MNASILPRHIAIIMDGNGRWAKQRLLPRAAGHKAGVNSVRQVVKACAEKKIEVLTLFAFSSENWRRPKKEVTYLMNLFISALEREAKKLHEENIKILFIGDRSRFTEKLLRTIVNSEKLTENNTGLVLVIAANYGGQWEICEAMRQIAVDIEQGHLTSQELSLELIESKLTTAHLPPPDLFIRTSGEQRISNFLLWQLAYSELYFTNVLWPDFNATEFDKALAFYVNRERRFGYTGDQLKVDNHV
jgi:undecaprenyl diphosphate synthase